MAKNKIAKLYPRDEKALIALSRCGHVSHDNLNTLIANKRIDGYIKDGLIKKEVFNTNDNKNFSGYKLTAAGRKLVEREFGFREHQIAQSLYHDVAISDKYFSLTQEQRDTWKTETTMRRELNEELEHLREDDYDRYEEITHKIERGEIS
ncbi:hypothetical protein B0H39_006008, partial [Clostridium beijerinckii]|uniref:hypothetical protein n=1 Tax=Clostridium beijerinckii TaxID=1520 RepID=UPI001A9AFE72